MGKIKVLHVITRLIVGGAQENTLFTIAGLDKIRYDVMLASGPSIGPEGDMQDFVNKHNIPFVKIPELVREIHPVKDIAAFIKLCNLIKKERFDIVHTHTSKAGILGRLAAKTAGCGIIIHTPHGHLFYNQYGRFLSLLFVWIERLMASMTTRIITLTETGKREHIHFRIAAAEKFRVAHSGIDMAAFSEVDQHRRDALRKELGLSPDDIVIGSVGRLVPIKGHRYLIEAAPDVIKKMPRVKFVIVGDGVLKNRLQKDIERRRLSEQFLFPGLRGDTRDLLSIFYILVHPSLYEGMGRVVAEAMALGKPVIASKTGGLPDVVGDAGLLVEPGDAKGLAEAIIALLDDKEKAKSLGEAGKERARRLFTMDSMVRKIDDIYKEAIWSIYSQKRNS